MKSVKIDFLSAAIAEILAKRCLYFPDFFSFGASLTEK